MNKKKLLILGGKPIGTAEIVNRAKDLGYYTICADYLPKSESVGKRLADESWDISTAEVEEISELCKVHNVDGIITGVHEFNINRMLDICDKTNLTCYCTKNTWIYCDSKMAFKQLCINNDICVAKKYNYEDRSSFRYPVITKPDDGSGSRGFHICNNVEELENGYKDALSYSPGKTVLIEDYIPYDAVIIHYTMDNGKCIFSGMSDKISVRFKNTGSSVMGIQTFPSKGEAAYQENLNAKVCRMFESAGFKNGPIWIEAFFDGIDKFVFNEMGYRFGGSLTYYPVRYFHQIDQLDALIFDAMHEHMDSLIDNGCKDCRKYCILPIHINPGVIKQICGENYIKERDDIYAYVPVHFCGDEIKPWGSAQQVFCYMHILYNDKEELKNSINEILKTLRVMNEREENMLFTLFDIESL